MSNQEIQHKIILEARDFVAAVDDRLKSNPEYGSTEYGHAAGNLAFILHVHTFHETTEEAERMQREHMIIKLKKLLKDFGPNILTYLRDELKLIIEEEKLLEK